MNERWVALVEKVRRGIWLTELVAVLVLLLVYKFTGNQTVLMLVFLSILVAATPMAAITMVIDFAEMDKLGEDD